MEAGKCNVNRLGKPGICEQGVNRFVREMKEGNHLHHDKWDFTFPWGQNIKTINRLGCREAEGGSYGGLV